MKPQVVNISKELDAVQWTVNTQHNVMMMNEMMMMTIVMLVVVEKRVSSKYLSK